MSENGDIEEGEIGDISDFEDGSLGGSRPVSPTNSESMMGVCGSRIATPEHKTPSKCCPDDHFGVRVGFAALNRYGCKASLPQLSDEEVVPHRKPSVQKRRKKRREWPQGGSRRSVAKHERSRCRFFLEGRCNKGAECPFSHEFAPPKKQELCKFYATSGCSKGSSCLFLHEEFPCKFFHLTRNCFHGNNCKFSHKPLTLSTETLLHRFDEKTFKGRSSENESWDRDNGSQSTAMQTQFPQGALAEPYGDVDYRRMVNTCLPNEIGPPGIPSGFQPRPSHRGHYDPPFPWANGHMPPGRAGLAPPLMRGNLRSPNAACHFPPVGYHHRQPTPEGHGVRYPPHHVREQNPWPYQNNEYVPPTGNEIPDAMATCQTDWDMHPGSSLPETRHEDFSSREEPVMTPEVTPKPAIPSMTVSDHNFVSLTDKTSPLGGNQQSPSVTSVAANTSTSSQQFTWELQALELEPRTPFTPSVSNAADPRLKVCTRLPPLLPTVLLTKELLAAVNDKKAKDGSTPSQTEAPPPKPPKRRTRMLLNENANELVLASAAAAAVQQEQQSASSSQSSDLPQGILDPRLLKRRRMEPVVVSASAVSPSQQSAASMRISDH